MLIAHSEGTLYANAVYNLLTTTQKKSVSLVYTAPVANGMADGSASYITNPRDRIIQGMRAYASLNSSFPSPMSTNMDSKVFPT